MKRKLFLIAVICIMALSMTACGAVTEAEEAIALIGEVTLDSRAELEHAEAMFQSLSDLQRSWVDNAETLQDARQEYDRQKAEVDAVYRAINSIIPVTPDSGEEIAAAEQMLNELTDVQRRYLTNIDALASKRLNYNNQISAIQGFRNAVNAIGEVTGDSLEAIQAAEKYYRHMSQKLTDYVEDEYAVLKAARDSYRQLQKYAQALLLFDNGSYQETVAYCRSILEETPYSDDMEKFEVLMSDALTLLVTHSLEAGDPEPAWREVMASSDYYYCVPYVKLKKTIIEYLENNRPANGTIFHNSIRGGKGQLVLISEDRDVYAKFVHATDPTRYVTFFVRKGEQVTISNIPDGSYYLKYADNTQNADSYWFGEERLFGEETNFWQDEEPFDYSTSFDAQYIYYDIITVTLSVGYRGTLLNPSSSISGDEF